MTRAPTAASGSIPGDSLARLSEAVAAQMGLHFPKERRLDLARGVSAAASALGFPDPVSCAESLGSRPLTKAQMAILAQHLTVGETYFFRESKTLEALRTYVLPEILRARRDGGRYLRVWSAGCSTGEEPYSLAMLLERWIPDFASWNVLILATDINPVALHRAEVGEYSEWSFRMTPAWMKSDPSCFTRTKNGRIAVAGKIKKRVRFAQLNLVEDSYPSITSNTNAMDVILCRNVLMYFSRKQATNVVHRLSSSLVEGGWLAVSQTENSADLFRDLTSVVVGGVTLNRKLVPRRGSLGGPPATLVPTPPVTPAVPVEQVEVVDVAAGVEQAGSVTAGRRGASFEEAVLLYQSGRYDDARARVQASLAAHGETAETLALLARIEANRGHFAEAAEWCTRVVTVDRTNPAGHYLLALIREELGQVKEAAGALRNALYLDPEFIPAHIALGGLLERQGRRGDADKHFSNALSLLEHLAVDQVLPELEGMTAGRLSQIIASGRARGDAA